MEGGGAGGEGNGIGIYNEKRFFQNTNLKNVKKFVKLSLVTFLFLKVLKLVKVLNW